MKLHIRNLLISNAPLKVISLILGYTTWYLLGNILTETRWYTIPLSFDNLNTELLITAPKTIQVLLSGKRNFIKNIDTDSLAAHINSAALKTGTQKITISRKQLFVPDSIKLVHYTPANILVHLEKKQNNENSIL